MYPVARGQQDLDELSQDQLSVLLPARNHELWGQLFDDVLNQLVDSTRRGSALSEGLASHVALQIGLVILANERITPPHHPRLLAEAACESVRVGLSCGRIASALKELWTESEIGLHTNSDYDKVTQGHYGSLFGEFDLRHYVTEASELLEARLSRNQIVRTDFVGRKVLDAGCGSGRYTHALASYGASEAIGVDFSPINISNANRLNSNYIKNSSVRFELADVRRLPFANQSFDIVFSNGVAHHLPEPREGVRELLRVLKPGGWGFFKVMPNPGGLQWDLVELARLVLWQSPYESVHRYFASLPIPANLRYYLLDHMLVPYNIRFSRGAIEKMLIDAGASDTRYLNRGADLDRVERIHRGETHAELRFGDGEARYWFSK